MVNKLYPPIISGTLPAFVGQEITIPFQMNRAVSMVEVSGLCYIIKTVSSNVVIAQGTTADFTPSKVRGCLEQGSITLGSSFTVTGDQADFTDCGSVALGRAGNIFVWGTDGHRYTLWEYIVNVHAAQG